MGGRASLTLELSAVYLSIQGKKPLVRGEGTRLVISVGSFHGGNDFELLRKFTAVLSTFNAFFQRMKHRAECVGETRVAVLRYTVVENPIVIHLWE